jgi:hypothetical protein
VAAVRHFAVIIIVAAAYSLAPLFIVLHFWLCKGRAMVQFEIHFPLSH